MKLNRSVCLILAGALSLPVSGPLPAAPMPNATHAFSVSTRGMKVSALLADIGANYGVPVMVSNSVTDIFVGSLRGHGVLPLLKTLAADYALAWYYDGNMLYVYKASEVRSEMIAPGYLPARDLVRHLQEDAIEQSSSCAVRPVGNYNALEVFGVPVCVERVLRLAKQLDQKVRAQQQAEDAVKIFPLRYASAADTSYAYRGQRVTVPGVASALREMSQGRSRQDLPGPVFAGAPGAQPAGTPPVPQATPGNPLAAAIFDERGMSAGLPLISVDARTNSVIVRDKKINLPLYADLIAQLDQRPEQIEISVVIIDVDAASMNNLGIDFGGTVGMGPARVEFGRGSRSSSGFSSILGGTADFFLRVNALEQVSKAKILSRPSVVTLNNMQAVLDHNITFYTKLEGESEVKLEAVSAGSLLRVTPRIVNEDGVNDILLTLDIQDGQQGAAISSAESLPQVKNSSISTQALLKGGQSLLLGGLLLDKSQEGERKVPWFGDLPLVGGLFRSKGSEARNVVRLFLIKAEQKSQES